MGIIIRARDPKQCGGVGGSCMIMWMIPILYLWKIDENCTFIDHVINDLPFNMVIVHIATLSNQVKWQQMLWCPDNATSSMIGTVLSSCFFSVTLPYAKSCVAWPVHIDPFYLLSSKWTCLVGGIPTPLKNMKVSWDYYSHIYGNVPNHQRKKKNIFAKLIPVQQVGACICILIYIYINAWYT